MNIGFIGLGNMGSGMAKNLLPFCQNNQHDFYVTDINPAAVTSLTALGAKSAESIKQMAQNCDIIFTSLPSSKEIKAIALGDEGLLQHAKSNLIWFETSTNKVTEWQEIRNQASSDISLIDAPVTGGAEGAAAGTLTMLIGTDNPAIIENNTEMLSAFTQKIAHMGPPGAGYVTKLSQLHLNYLVAQGIGEALMLGKKADIDLNQLWEVLKTSCAQSYVVEAYIPKVLDGSYDPTFALGLATKDMRLISELGKHLNIDLILGNTVYQAYCTANEKYGHDAPHLSIIKLIEEQAKCPLN